MLERLEDGAESGCPKDFSFKDKGGNDESTVSNCIISTHLKGMTGTHGAEPPLW